MRYRVRSVRVLGAKGKSRMMEVIPSAPVRLYLIMENVIKGGLRDAVGERGRGFGRPRLGGRYLLVLRQPLLKDIDW